MAILEDIEVRVARNTTGKAMSDKIGEALPEYEKPNRSRKRPNVKDVKKRSIER